MNPAIPSSAQRPDGAGGCLLDCHVQPGASRTALAGAYGERLKIALQAPPVEGRANRELCRFLSRRLGIPASKIEIIRGLTGRDKTIRCPGLTPEAAANLLEQQ